jgi:RNA polymerase sigma-70 factor (ECF subfamily)
VTSHLDDDALLRALRGGDEETFAGLVVAWSPTMLRMARARVRSRAVAEEIVQEAWLTMLRDLDHFERRSSLRTWVCGIVVNLARTRGRAERRSTPVGHVASDDPWPTPEQEVLAGETRDVVLTAVAGLPPSQRDVLVLRDLEGWSARETCSVLALSDGNQRVLLHRARSRVRKAVADYVAAPQS